MFVHPKDNTIRDVLICFGQEIRLTLHHQGEMRFFTEIKP